MALPCAEKDADCAVLRPLARPVVVIHDGQQDQRMHCHCRLARNRPPVHPVNVHGCGEMLEKRGRQTESPGEQGRGKGKKKETALGREKESCDRERDGRQEAGRRLRKKKKEATNEKKVGRKLPPGKVHLRILFT